MRLRLPDGLINVACLCQSVDKVPKRVPPCSAKGVSMAADAKFDAALSDQARSLWGKSDYGNNAGNPLFLVALSCNY